MGRAKSEIVVNNKQEAEEKAKTLVKANKDSYWIYLEDCILFCGTDKTITIKYT